ncbi:citramalate synthase [Egicoccus sp. AB-alg6-2]|uniref:citramalate synthase n=1 Tax=Egicoccus sp. AB-alg6-2 TaxID=3242692 RepID=UPI00359D8CD8
MTSATHHSPLPEPGPGLDLYDTTLRDGTQREGVSLSVDDKLRVARRMDELGVAYIEGGWPGANPKDTEFFARAADGELALGSATLVAFGMTRGPGRAAEADPLLQALVDARTEVVCLVGKSWGYHVDEALGVPRHENLDMVTDSIRHLTGLGKRVFFDAEHFFDGFGRDNAYAREVAAAAAEAGAECVVLCDTNGGAMPWDVAEIVGGLVRDLPSQVGLHFHDDGGCAVANTLLGVEAGATHVQGTANGLGERCGNANLFTILADLQLKRGLELVAPDRLERLTEISHTVAELCNQNTPSIAPYVGHTAFSHKAGLHASALAKAPDMYQHIEPEDVGNRQRLVVSELAGRSNILLKAKELGVDIDDDQARAVLAEVKRREAEGWTYEAADASFELLLRRTTGSLPPTSEPFRSQHYRVSVAGGSADLAGAQGPAEAILAVDVGGQRRLGAGEGNGPVDALDHAFRNAVNGTWPQLDRVHLSDYKVRVLEASAGTDAVTRVLVTSTDGVDVWDTVGVHPNVVEASWLALADAYTHAILRVDWHPQPAR